MARNELDYVVPDEGRDKGKVFHLTEMSATQAEKWATRALLAVAASGVDIGSAIGSGMLGVAQAGIQSLAKIRPADAEPLLDELMTCIRFKPDPRNPGVIRALIEDDIEEVATRVKLKIEVVKLHVNFSQNADPSTSGLAAASTTTAQPLPNMSMSPAQSEPVFHPAKRRRQS